MALSSAVRPNLMEAGEKLFLDLLPETWKGMPPGLPQDVIEELSRRAREAEETRAAAAAQEGRRGDRGTSPSASARRRPSRASSSRCRWSRPVEMTADGDRVELVFDAACASTPRGCKAALPPHRHRASRPSRAGRAARDARHPGRRRRARLPRGRHLRHRHRPAEACARRSRQGPNGKARPTQARRQGRQGRAQGRCPAGTTQAAPARPPPRRSPDRRRGARVPPAAATLPRCRPRRRRRRRTTCRSRRSAAPAEAALPDAEDRRMKVGVAAERGSVRLTLPLPLRTPLAVFERAGDRSGSPPRPRRTFDPSQIGLVAPGLVAAGRHAPGRPALDPAADAGQADCWCAPPPASAGLDRDARRRRRWPLRAAARFARGVDTDGRTVVRAAFKDVARRALGRGPGGRRQASPSSPAATSRRSLDQGRRPSSTSGRCATAQGLAIMPISDDVAVKPGIDEVRDRRDGGLAVSLLVDQPDARQAGDAGAASSPSTATLGARTAPAMCASAAGS